jgi:hypothetical protein
LRIYKGAGRPDLPRPGLRDYPYHPLLISSFHVLLLFAVNINQTEIGPPLKVLILTLLITILLFSAAAVLSKDPGRAASLTTLTILLFFSYGRLFDIVPGIRIGGVVIGRNKFLLPLYGLAAVLGIVWIFRGRTYVKKEQDIHRFLNIFGLALILGTAVMGAFAYDWRAAGYGQDRRAQGEAPKKAVPVSPTEERGRDRPNIYFLVFDSYASPRVLRRYYQWDDSAFTGALKQRGFAVTENGFSNYPFTSLSVASTLNMGYVHEENEFREAKNKSAFLVKRIEKNLVMDSFAAQGYDIVVPDLWESRYRSGLKPGRPSDDAERKNREFAGLVVHTSLLRVIEKELSANILRENILSSLQKLSQAERPIRPTFLYAHIVCPHPPYLFRWDGSPTDLFSSAWGRIENSDGYIQQVRFIGTQIIATVDDIRKRDPQGLIIVQADHGHGYALGDHLLNRERPPEEFLIAQFGILSAVSLPPGLVLPPCVTPINQFRYLLNDLFGAGYPGLPERAFFTPIKEPFRFRDVTSVLMESDH